MLRTVLNQRKVAAAVVARAWLPTSAVSRRGFADHQTNRQKDTEEEDEVGVDPPVSLYARIATTVLIGGGSYYLYSEYGSAIARHLPWPAKQSTDTQPSAAATEAKSRKSRLQAKLAPKSELSYQEQVNWAWTHPGLYVVGSNEYGLVDPMHPGHGVGLRAAVPGLEGKLLRGAAFAKTHAAAVDVDGNLYQWGTGFTAGSAPHMPQCTLSNSGITAVATSRDYVVLLDRKSHISLVRGDNSQLAEQAPPTLAFEPRLGWRENVVAVSAGEDHIAATTSSGHVYTCALGPSGNDRSQLGHGSTAVEPFVLRRIESDRSFTSAVCGGRHTLLLTADGDVWGCGANDFGQLATGSYTEATRTISELTPLRALWEQGIFQSAKASALRIAAGAKSSYFQVSRSGSDLDLLAVGCGIDGQLGSGAFTHIQGRPTRIAALSGVSEVDTETGLRRPVGVRSISANGSSDHVAIVCDNHTNVKLDKSAQSVTKSPIFGYDVMVWGSNSSGQCIPDRKHRFAEPTHPPPLYLSKSSEGQDQQPPRLQAAPRQWVSAASFQRSGSNSGSSSSKKYLVEQEFVTGSDVTAAFLKSV
ncbi:hypothetical protein IWW39_001799 [Coemansia spiralis]|uniref:Uncharacterized protein n=1 Tax=Coemansia spiralis TaxID=417178 RepID=A0A9W8L660_9FUNG|nr:hypothetical protein IWW39_001799 [Coemansia spiralis]